MKELKLWRLATCLLALVFLAPVSFAPAADLTVTAANVSASASATTADVTAGETITAGQPVYLDTTSSNQAKRCLATTLAASKVYGIALNNASVGQPLKVLTGGAYNPGATAVVGQVYAVSVNAGGIAPYSDLISTNYVTVLGVATTAGNIIVKPIISGIQKP